MREPKLPATRKLGRRPKQATPGREALLDAAYRTFARLGYEGTSLRDVAAQSGVDAALVSRLFGSKIKLWEAVIERLADFLASHLDEIAAIHTQPIAGGLTDQAIATARLKTLIALFGRIARQIPEFPAFIMLEMVDPGPRFAYLKARLIGNFWTACEPILNDAIHTSVVRMNQPFLLMFTLLQSISVPMLVPSLFWGEDAKALDLDQIESMAVSHMMSLVISEKA